MFLHELIRIIVPEIDLSKILQQNDFKNQF